MTLLSGIYTHTPVDTSDIAQAALNIEAKSRVNPLPWNGQFSPQLVEALLDRYALPGMNVLDPFLGSGTVLLEAGRAGLSVTGTEINPAAIILSRTYRLINVPVTSRKSQLQTVGEALAKVLADPSGSYNSGDHETDCKRIEKTLVDTAAHLSEPVHQTLLNSLIILLDVYKRDFTVSTVFSIWNRLAKLVLNLPFSPKPIEVFHADARGIPIPKSSIDLVITSPPYINVFNYHQHYRASAELLGWNLLTVARSEIGSNRKNRGNRFLTVIQFCLDLAQVLEELTRVCRTSSRIVFIVGRESMVRGTRFFNGEIVAEVATRALELTLLLRQERVFVNRFGQRIYEDILHFSPPQQPRPESFLASTRNIAKDMLIAASRQAPATASADIESALANADLVRPSPIFEASIAYIKPRGAKSG